MDSENIAGTALSDVASDGQRIPAPDDFWRRVRAVTVPRNAMSRQ
jgi:hypothetical protein